MTLDSIHFKPTIRTAKLTEYSLKMKIKIILLVNLLFSLTKSILSKSWWEASENGVLLHNNKTNFNPKSSVWHELLGRFLTYQLI